MKVYSSRLKYKSTQAFESIQSAEYGLIYQAGQKISKKSYLMLYLTLSQKPPLWAFKYFLLESYYMSIIYDVPMVNQIDTNLCWHASAEMIWLYWQQVTDKQGPMNTLLQRYAGNKALPVKEARAFAEKVGFKPVVDTPIPFYFNNSQIIEDTLRKFGPLWCGGNWYGRGHVIVT
jgi:hypothetical protein